MKIKDIMIRQVKTIQADESVEKLFFLFNTESIRHLPVIHDGKLAGIVSERDLKKILPPKAKKITRPDGTSYSVLDNDSLPHGSLLLLRFNREGYAIGPIKVSAIMKTKIISISPDDNIYDAASTMAEKKIGSLLVLDNKKLVGIITTTDLLYALVKLKKEGGNSK